MAEENGEEIGEESGGVDTVDNPEDLKAQLEELKTRLSSAETRARTAEQTVRRSQSELVSAGERVQQSEMQIVTTALEKLKGDAEGLEVQYEQAAAEGNHRLMASLSRQMAMNASQLTALEAGKQRLEYEATAPKPTVGGPPPRLPGESDAEYLAKQLPPRAAAWVRKHPQYASGNGYVEMIAAHNLWIARHPGTEETDAYFAAIERNLGFVDGLPPGGVVARPATGDGATANDPVSSAGAAAAPRRSANDTSPPAAPPSRGGGGNGVRLTPAQREAAAISGMTEKEYADNLEKTRREGRVH